ncbi:ABC transporter permease [Listeria ivanovii]|uniref:ABC transporter permease n=2 Tax=Listeria ivanovii TaxID=1638 RepID=A0ABS1G683_LISIV|nr:ABC transporter permease [Listeria ivanovii]MBC2256220.1 ABC transporter permease [Listeria ivanovii]MBK1962372.1 ABC transporter permease [Listeria ivanovii subsp. londoniensis]MBK1967404.1 ABC transporter permease [Listeria ivanovii subsp. londoniensis]MBK1985305.1 ABC transporter permease [Listeria ivanovii subsp. londoniensis]MBK1996725.1 ABC transporter permease [Listeria ivanovii subsp. londoniensis]
MLFKVALTNMRKNFTQFIVYFVSLIVCVLVFFTFVSLSYNPLIDKVFTRWELFGPAMFSTASLILILFIFFFIFYSNSFFLKRRKREIGLYSLLGLRKSQIALVLFYENAMMYMLATFFGILLGIFFSKMFAMVLFWIVGLAIDAEFMITFPAITDTIMVFLAIMLFTSVYASFIVLRYNLSQLFKNDDKEEKVAKGSLLLMVVGIALIGFGYYLATSDVEESSIWLKYDFFDLILLILGAVILGTWLTVRFGTPYVIQKLYQNKHFFYNGSNMIGITSLRFRLKKNASTIAMIAVLSATTLTIIGSMSSFYVRALGNINEENPSSYQVRSMTAKNEKEIIQTINTDKNHQLKSLLKTEMVRATLEYGDIYNKNGEPREMIHPVVSESEYNRIAAKQQRNFVQPRELQYGEAILLGKNAYFARKEIQDKWLSREMTVKTDKPNAIKISPIKVIDFREFSIFNTGISYETLVVSDEYYNDIKKFSNPELVGMFNITNPSHSEELDKKVQTIVDGKPSLFSEDVSSYYTTYHMISILVGSLLFIGVFIGIVFFLATGSIIYFKLVTDAVTEKSKFDILFKLGVTENEIRKIISKQIWPIFVIPLFFGIAHSMVALWGISINLIDNIKYPVLIGTGIYMLCFGAYYMLCVNSFTKIVTADKK